MQEQFGYAYDNAGNLNERTNNALIQSFAVNNVNELSSAGQSGTLTVACPRLDIDRFGVKA